MSLEVVSYQMPRRIALALGLAARRGYDSLDPDGQYTVADAVGSTQPCTEPPFSRDEWTEVEEMILGLECAE